MVVNSVVGLVSKGRIRSGIRREGVRTKDSYSRTSLFGESELAVLVLSTSSEGSSWEFIYKRLAYHILALKRTILQTNSVKLYRFTYILSELNTEHFTLLLREVRHKANVRFAVHRGDRVLLFIVKHLTVLEVNSISPIDTCSVFNR